jgi:hypothetical protein
MNHEARCRKARSCSDNDTRKGSECNKETNSVFGVYMSKHLTKYNRIHNMARLDEKW